MARPATRAEVTKVTQIANAKNTCGFTAASGTLTSVKVTNYAVGTVTARSPKDQGNAGM